MPEKANGVIAVPEREGIRLVVVLADVVTYDLQDRVRADRRDEGVMRREAFTELDPPLGGDRLGRGLETIGAWIAQLR